MSNQQYAEYLDSSYKTSAGLEQGVPIQAGMFLGTSIHDTAQATGAGMMYNQLWQSKLNVHPTAMDVAVVTKLVRNTFMAVLIPLISYVYVKRNEVERSGKVGFKQVFPLFVAGFVVFALINSLGDYLIVQKQLLWNADAWNRLGKLVQSWSGYFIAVAMTGVGLGTDVKTFKKQGIKPFLVGLFAAFTIGLVSFVLIKIFING